MIKFLIILTLALFSITSSATADIIDDVYITLSADYINSHSNKEIMLKGIKALTKTDKSVKFKYTKDKLFFYYNKKMIQSFPMPLENENAQKWADFTKDIIKKAMEVSPKIELLDFEIPDRFAQSVFDGLDGYSHYYGKFSDKADKKPRIRRNFATRIVDNDILLIKILAFRKDVNQKVKTAIDECSKCKALILDLRGNHGGLFDEALKITDMFLDEGIVTYTLSKDGVSPKFYTSTAGDVFNNKPIVILVDGFSASASEILSAALSEQNRAVLIGTKTYGKGTVQDVLKDGKGSTMSITTSYFYTPGGNIIDKKGLTPAICTGGLKLGHLVTDGVCDKEDRFTKDADVEIAVKFLNNEI